MKWFRVHYSTETGIKTFELEATDEKDAKFQFYAQCDDITDGDIEIEQFIKPVQPIFARVHLGFITVNLIPEIAEKLGYKEGDRFANEKAMFDAIGTQNIHIVELWYKDRDKDMPTDFLEAAKFMVESVQNTN